MIRRVKRNADLLVAVDRPMTDVERYQLQSDIREHFSGHRAIVFHSGDAQITPLVRPFRQRYYPSLLAHGGKVRP